jgi:16S rRNA (adenine1518-N6/adenine1519-N6)-dimethyltransferase
MSAIIRLIPHSQPPVTLASMAAFSQVVTHAFSQRRKTIRNSLKDLLTEQQIAGLGINPGARAETLTLEEFAILSNLAAGAAENPATI